METQNDIKNGIMFWKLGIMDIKLNNGNTISIRFPKKHSKIVSFFDGNEMICLD